MSIHLDFGLIDKRKKKNVGRVKEGLLFFARHDKIMIMMMNGIRPVSVNSSDETDGDTDADTDAMRCDGGQHKLKKKVSVDVQ
mmetsp:Transcript_17973/g.18189  ORF Transcript_17973/g.18189 Transcript_17973/m.18189 type:complete len:83 (-) Transcript_17973:7-255(-)